MFIDPELRAFAEGKEDEVGSGERRSVIVEVRVRPVIPPGKSRSKPESSTRDEDARTYQALAAALEALAVPMVRFSEIGSFAVEVTANELRRIMAMPLVGAIRQNRTHQAPKPRATRTPH